jgi:hypothetical protein
MSNQRFLSDDLTHFVGRSAPTAEAQFEILVKILQQEVLLPRPDFDRLHGTVSLSATGQQGETFPMDIVCFCDIPLSDLQFHMRKYSQFGISFDRNLLVARGANPVFYLAENGVQFVSDLTEAPGPGADYSLQNARECYENVLREGKFVDPKTRLVWNSTLRGTHYVDRLQTIVWSKLEYSTYAFLGEVFGFLKRFDASLPHDDPKSFYTEREWRVRGSVFFSLNEVKRVFMPSKFAYQFRSRIPEYYGQIHFTD